MSDITSLVSNLNNASGESAGSILKSAVIELKNASKESSWSQNDADTVGVAIIGAAERYKEAVMTPLEMKLEDAITAQKTYEAQYKAAINERDSHVKYRDVDTQMGTRNKSATSMGHKEKYIDNQGAYDRANQRANEAKQKKAQQHQLEEKIKSEISSVEAKIDDFIMDTFEIPLMNESVSFLSKAYKSDAVSSSRSQNILGGQLFYITNEFRDKFDEFEKFLDAHKDQYAKIDCVKDPDYLAYGGHVDYSIEKKFVGDISFKLYSGKSDEISLHYDAKNEYVFKKDKVETACAKLKEKAKAFEIENDGNIISLKLAKKSEGDNAIAEMKNVEADLNSYKEEGKVLLATAKENGASTNKLLLGANKIGNWWAKTKLVKFMVAHPRLRKGLKIGFISIVSLVALLAIFIGVGTVYLNNTWKNYSITADSDSNDTTIGKVLGVNEYLKTEDINRVYVVADEKLPAAKKLISKTKLSNKEETPERELTSEPYYLKRFDKYKNFEEDGTTCFMVINYTTKNDPEPFIDLIEISTDAEGKVTSYKGTRQKFSKVYFWIKDE